MAREAFVRVISDWKVIFAAVCGLPVAGFTVAMVMWGQPAKASTVSMQGEIIVRQGNDIAAAKQGFSDLEKAMDRQERRTMRVEDKIDAMNEKMDLALRQLRSR